MKECDNVNGQSLHCSFETPFLLGAELKRECLVEDRVASAVLRPSLLLLHYAPRRAQLQYAYIRSCRKRKGTRHLVWVVLKVLHSNETGILKKIGLLQVIFSCQKYYIQTKPVFKRK